MRLCALLCTATLGAICSTTSAQSATLTTTFAGGNGLGAGASTYFDLDVLAGITITGLDIHVDTAGAAGTIDIYQFATTAFGNEAMGAPPWTLIGTGTYTSNGPGVPTPVTLSGAGTIPLPAGQVGIAICYNGTGVDYTNGAGAMPTDVFTGTGLTLTAGTSSPTCLNATSIFSSRIANVAITYDLPAGIATESKYGSGCGENAGSFYEIFDGTASAFDFGGTPGGENTFRVSLAPIWHYKINKTNGSPAFFTPVSAPLPLTDDSVFPQALPFPMPLLNGTVVNDITISSNGFVWLNGTNTVSDFSESVGELLGGDPRIAVLWDDLNVADATSPGSIHYDVDPSGTAIYVTYLNVVEFGAAGAANGPNTAQLMIDDAGNFELRYGTVGLLDALVGLSMGGGAADPGNSDLSVVTPIFRSVDADNMSLCSDARPVIGTSVNLVTTDIPASTLLGATILSFGQINPGAPTPFAGCQLHVGSGATLLFFGGPTNSQALAIPNDPTLSGSTVYAQSAVLTAADPLDGLTSNGVELTIGTL